MQFKCNAMQCNTIQYNIIYSNSVISGQPSEMNNVKIKKVQDRMPILVDYRHFIPISTRWVLIGSSIK